MRNIIVIGLLAGVAMALAACSGAGSSNVGQSRTVEAQDLALSPTALEVTAGDPVQLTLQNKGALDHDKGEVPTILTSTLRPGPVKAPRWTSHPASPARMSSGAWHRATTRPA